MLVIITFDAPSMRRFETKIFFLLSEKSSLKQACSNKLASPWADLRTLCENELMAERRCHLVSHFL